MQVRGTYTLSLGVIGEMGRTMVGVFTPFLFDKAPPWKSHTHTHRDTRGEARRGVSIRKRKRKVEENFK